MEESKSPHTKFYRHTLCRCYKTLHGLDVHISQNLRNNRNEAPCPLPKIKIKTRELLGTFIKFNTKFNMLPFFAQWKWIYKPQLHNYPTVVRAKELDIKYIWKLLNKMWTLTSHLHSKITADGDCSHEIKRRLLLGRKVMTNLDSILKSRDITFPTKVRLVKAMVFPVVMCGCESWTVKKAEHRRIDAFELWC